MGRPAPRPLPRRPSTRLRNEKAPRRGREAARKRLAPSRRTPISPSDSTGLPGAKTSPSLNVALKAKRVLGQPAAGRTPAARRRPDGGRAGRPGDGDGLTADPGCAEDCNLTRMVSAGGEGYEWR